MGMGATTKTTPRWEHFSHESDIGIRGLADTLEEAFVQAALGLTAVITDVAAVSPREKIGIACTGADREILLLDWINALIYEMATRKMLFSRFSVTFTGDGLQGQAWGEPIDVAKHHPAVEIKGATFTELKVCRDKQGTWVAQCVVDV